jgi:hypothetical protein
MLNYIGGGDGIYMNYRFAQPTRTHRQHIARWFPEFQFPFADLTIFDPVTRQIDGRLARCEETNTCPNIFETNSENEFWAKGGSMLLTDGRGHDLDLSRTPNVRYFTCCRASSTAPATAPPPAFAGSSAIRSALRRWSGRSLLIWTNGSARAFRPPPIRCRGSATARLSRLCLGMASPRTSRTPKGRCQ